MRALAALCVLTSTTAADNKCVIEKLPVVTAPAVSAPACKRAAPALAGKLTREITKRYHPTQTNAKAKVSFPCDGLGVRIDEVVFENGNGHGGSLGFFRAKRVGNTFEVRGIAYRGASMIRPAPNPPFERVTGTVTLDLERLRAATTAEVTEVVPPPKPNEGIGFSGTSSSRDFHLLIRLVDSEGRVVERTFTGYESSSGQLAFLPLLAAAEAMAPITALPGAKVTADDDDRALFAERFNAAVPRFDKEFSWWVMERYVDLARFLGTPKVIAGLLTRMKVADPNDRSKVDARKDALEALANITGWDARNNATDEQAAAAYTKQCR